MTKEIKIILEKDNSLKLKCNEKIIDIKENTISSLDIYQLMEYNYGDIYTVKLENNGGKEDIAKPIKEMFDKVVIELNEMKSPDERFEEELNELEDEKIDEFDDL
ncbi:MAG: hypothetical protein RR738_02700 [Anaerorhabdus sp.]|uniref:hypothetical protein n=1 Tax=Anaerorhabdus sp. TaxID=1872524 RepID=UPI002FCA858D